MSAPQDDYVHGRKIIKAESLSQHRLQGREGLLRATEATEELFRAVGMKEPLPFTKPPAVPHTLEKKFEDGLAEYGVDANGPATNAKQRLSNIIEENNKDSMSSVDSAGQQVAPFAPREQDASSETRSDRPNTGFFGPSLAFRPNTTLEPTGKTEGSATFDEVSKMLSSTKHNFGNTMFQDRHKNETLPTKVDELTLPKINKPAQSPWREDLFGPVLEGPRVQGGTGLPIITWNSLEVMMKFQDRLSHPQSFAVHPAFPLQTKHPTRKRLISVSFYDTTTNPHQEIRFFGPGDVTDIVYAEVDVFKSIEVKKNRSMDQMKYASTGEGRWAFIHIEDHGVRKSWEAQFPFVLLAWQISTVTSTSQCVHTIYPDGAPTTLPPIRPQSSGRSVRRLVSLSQMQDARLQKQRLYEAIRSESISELAQAEMSSDLPLVGSHKFVRTVIKLGKPGNIPLIEGHRVDIPEFGKWMDAVARGQGKVVLWAERPRS
ncbi:hypothetical protein PTMSG1_00108 [Pyrenophora teres f. maculata]|nr:hypothetical protein PTMSG1_00108 [Pyrenophora teres f. maculata]